MADLLVAVPVVRYSPDASPPFPWVAVGKVLLNSLSVPSSVQ